MTDYIEREAAIDAISEWLMKALHPENMSSYNEGERAAYRTAISEIAELPAADVRPVVLCGVCELHGHCYTEDVFAFARLSEENRFCAVGKVKTNGEWGEES